MHDWLKDWPALALACGLPLNRQGRPRIPSPSQQCKRLRAAGAPLFESLFVLTILLALHRRLIGARDLIIDSAPILAWRRSRRCRWPCPSSPSASIVTGLSRSYFALSWLWFTSLVPSLSRKCSTMLRSLDRSCSGQFTCTTSCTGYFDHPFSKNPIFPPLRYHAFKRSIMK